MIFFRGVGHVICCVGLGTPAMAASQPCDESEPWMFYKCLVAKPHYAGLVFAMLDGLNVFLKKCFQPVMS